MKLFYTTSNDYLRNIYFESLLHYKPTIQLLDSLNDARKDTVILDAEHLTPEVITRLKHNGNKIIAFDINDNSCFCYSYYGSEEIMEVDHILKVAGIQKYNSGLDITIDNECEYGLVSKPFMDQTNWEIYEYLKKANRIHPLPYVLWENYSVPNVPFEHRTNKVLVRGGHHYLRVHLLFNLIKKGLVDDSSVFNTRGYIGQYCSGCRDIFNAGEMHIGDVHNSPLSCKIPSYDQITRNFFQDRGDWNNSCPSRYLQMAELMGVDNDKAAHAMNGSYLHMTDFYDVLNKYTTYADLKWLFSIYAPPRFWEAATAHTVNLVPARTNDQEYFPHMEDNSHYITYLEDFSDIDDIRCLREGDFKRISDNTYDLYDFWIKSGQFKLSTNLMDHILAIIEG